MNMQQTEEQEMNTLEKIREIIEMATPMQRCAIEVITHLVKADKDDLAREVGDLMRKAGQSQGADLIFPHTDVWDRLRASVTREEFQSWFHFLCALVIAGDRISAMQLEQLIETRVGA